MYLALGGAACWSVFAPALAQAGLFDIAGALLPHTAASASAEQSRPGWSMALAAATNIDPRPSSDDDVIVAQGALVAQKGPSGTAAEIASRPKTTQISVHVVRPGDTISGIAEMFGVSVNTIKWANDLQNGVIQVGQELVIFPVDGVSHTIAKGDTTASLAKKYNADEEEILQHNDLAGGLVVGQTVLIPNGTIASAPAQTRTPSAASSAGTSGSPYIRPVKGVVSQGLHGKNAVDIAAAPGTPVYAAAAGKVIIARTGWNGGYGNYVVIQHQRSQTLYAHLSSISVSAGESVAQGEHLGGVGNTGQSTGPHLHFEIKGAVNPFAR